MSGKQKAVWELCLNAQASHSFSSMYAIKFWSAFMLYAVDDLIAPTQTFFTFCTHGKPNKGLEEDLTLPPLQ